MVAMSGPWGRLAPSLVVMVHEADRAAPRRSTASDGSIGNQEHAARSSFHNPEHKWVDALDLTNDPGHGWDVHARARELVARGDRRLDHVISNREIWSALIPRWRPYSGTNPHVHHAHFAVKRSPVGRAPLQAWWPLQSRPPVKPPVIPPTPPTPPSPPHPLTTQQESADMFTYEFNKAGLVLLVLVSGGAQILLTGNAYLERARSIGLPNNTHYLFEPDEVARAAKAWGPIIS